MKSIWYLTMSLSLTVISCSSVSPKRSENTRPEIPFSYFDNTFMVVSVEINDKYRRDFILDTGIGVNLISKSLAEKLNCKIQGEHVGRRMSGQEIRVSMTSLPSLSINSYKAENVPVGVFDIESMMPGTQIEGFLSLGFFKNVPHTVDYKRKTISLEDSHSLETIRSEGVRVPIHLDIQGPSLGIFMPLILPNKQEILVEIDTGSQALILNKKLMKPLGISPEKPSVKRRDGTDETGNSYSRFSVRIDGSIHPPQSSKIKLDQPKTMFQEIIYDGLVGHYFLSQFRVTYDLPHLELIFRTQ